MEKLINITKILAVLLTALFAGSTAMACTSMLVSSEASASRRPLLWKHRDTGTPHNFVQVVTPIDGYKYVALFNGGDSLLLEAWAGFNETGFAIMNTASYNLAPDTAKIKDREAIVMSQALRLCRTVEDFANLLDTLPKPMGVQANFGVIDAEGNGAYFETDDFKYTRFNLGETPEDNGILLRTNFSVSGNDTDGMGYIRYQNALDILADDIAGKNLSPQSFTEKASRSFWHSLRKKDFEKDTEDKYVVDQDFIPRRITSASVVVEGINPGGDPADIVMWVMIGYTPCSYAVPVTLDYVPDELQPLESGYRSRLCNEVLERKDKAFPIKRGSGKNYIDMDYIRSIEPEMRQKSEYNYNNFNKQ